MEEPDSWTTTMQWEHCQHISPSPSWPQALGPLCPSRQGQERPDLLTQANDSPPRLPDCLPQQRCGAAWRRTEMPAAAKAPAGFSNVSRAAPSPTGTTCKAVLPDKHSGTDKWRKLGPWGLRIHPFLVQKRKPLDACNVLLAKPDITQHRDLFLWPRARAKLNYNGLPFYTYNLKRHKRYSINICLEWTNEHKSLQKVSDWVS